MKVNCQNCGAEMDKCPADLKRGYGKFCSTDCKYEAMRKHGLTTKDADNVGQYSYSGAIERCHNPNNRAFKYYGARGIKVCDRWRFGDGIKTGLECFLEDMGPRPSAKHSIDRIDCDGDYAPGNCRWATWDVQVSNKRNVKRVRRSDGEEFANCKEASASVNVTANAIGAVCRGREKTAGGYGWEYVS